MRVIVFYISLCLLMLSGSTSLHAASPYGNKPAESKHTPVKRQHTKLNNNRQDNSILDEAEIDLDEDYLDRHDQDDARVAKFAIDKYTLQNWLYCNLCPELLLASYNKRYTSILPFRVGASPLYITQRVLKI